MDHQPDSGGSGSFLSWRRQHALAAGTPCGNCGSALLGPWCHACGQAAHDTHRQAHHLVAETFESLFHADGRLWNTLPRLVLHPGSLTRDYLAGRRASQVPPMRLFLVALFLFFLVGSWAGGGRAFFEITPLSATDQAELNKTHIDFSSLEHVSPTVTHWLKPRVDRAVEHPERLGEAMSARAHDFAFLMLPLSAFILALIFVFQRRFVLFDHFVFSMHSLAFQGFLICTVLLADFASRSFIWLLWCAPLHLFFHMRVAYGTGVAGTLTRMAVLFLASGLAFSLLLAGLVLAGLEGLHA